LNPEFATMAIRSLLGVATTIATGGAAVVVASPTPINAIDNATPGIVRRCGIGRLNPSNGALNGGGAVALSGRVRRAGACRLPREPIYRRRSISLFVKREHALPELEIVGESL
jgi:hypothetical protein